MSNYPVCEDAGNSPLAHQVGTLQAKLKHPNGYFFAAVAIKSVGTDLTPLQEFNVDTQLFDAL